MVLTDSVIAIAIQPSITLRHIKSAFISRFSQIQKKLTKSHIPTIPTSSNNCNKKLCVASPTVGMLDPDPNPSSSLYGARCIACSVVIQRSNLLVPRLSSTF